MRPGGSAAPWPEDDDQCAHAGESARSEIEHLRSALDRRLVIGQAQGMLMERLGIDACQSIGYLRRTSSQLNRKVFVIAKDIVRTRDLPAP